MMRSLRMMIMATVPFLVLAACEPAAQEEQVPAVEEMPPTEEMPQAAPMAPAPMTPDTMMPAHGYDDAADGHDNARRHGPGSLLIRTRLDAKERPTAGGALSCTSRAAMGPCAGAPP